MASYHLGLETVCSPPMHLSRCCDIDSRCFPSSQTCSGRSFLNQTIPILHPHRPSSLQFCISCSESESQASTKKPKTSRPSRAFKSDAALRSELQLFLASAGLPSNQVPSTTELSSRGREDLAKIVRRRGYKAVAKLLSNPDMISNVASKENMAPSVKRVAVTEDSLEPSLNGSARPGRTGISDDNVQGSESRSLIEQLKENDISFREAGDTGMAKRNDLSTAPRFDGSHVNIDSLNEAQTEEQLLRERAINFVKTGQLDHVEGEGDDEEVEDPSDYEFDDSSDEDDNERGWDEQNSAEETTVEQAARLRSELLPYIRDGTSDKVNSQENDALIHISQRKKEAEHVHLDDSGLQPAFTKGSRLELDHIKLILHNREMELLEMSRDLEEVKAQLALAQAKSTADLAQAKQLALEKDIRLKSANEALANLKQVQIEYWGAGQVVELAGSFNGWTHFICLEPDPTSEITKADGSRGPMMWETELWLYPGIYEVKFIVDGNWQIDERREVALRNSNLNNVLRVEQ